MIAFLENNCYTLVTNFEYRRIYGVSLLYLAHTTNSITVPSYMNSNQQVVRIWCVISDQKGEIVSLANSTPLKKWNIPCGTLSNKDTSLSSAVCRIVLEATGFDSILQRMALTRVVSGSSGKLELNMWFICIPITKSIPKFEVSSWISVKHISPDVLPRDIIRQLAATVEL